MWYSFYFFDSSKVHLFFNTIYCPKILCFLDSFVFLVFIKCMIRICNVSPITITSNQHFCPCACYCAQPFWSINCVKYYLYQHNTIITSRKSQERLYFYFMLKSSRFSTYNITLYVLHNIQRSKCIFIYK